MEIKNRKIYKHTNKINEKVYIGVTKALNPNERWQNGHGYKNNEDFWNDICLYGWNEGFKHEILFDDLTKEEAIFMEQFYIALYDSTDEEKGYNISKGGGGTNGRKYTEEENVKRNNRKKVICVETGKIYSSLTEVVDKFGGSVGNLSHYIRNNKKYKGFTFKIYQDEN